MMRTTFLAVLALCTLGVAVGGAAGPAVKTPVDPAPWVNLSDPIVQKLKADGKKFGFAGETAGVVVDAASGDVYMIVNEIRKGDSHQKQRVPKICPHHLNRPTATTLLHSGNPFQRPGADESSSHCRGDISMMRTTFLAVLALFTLGVAQSGAAAPAVKTPVDPAPWVNLSDPIVQKLKADGKKFGFAGETAGVVVDPASGDVYMIVNGIGIWKSSDGGKTFAQSDDGKVGGRCETSFALNADPAGKRIACFMLDGKCAWTGDSGATWNAMADVGRNWDYAAVDWSGAAVQNIFAAHHEDGGQTLLSNDGGKTWTKVFKQGEFDKTGGLGIFDDKTLVYTQKGAGILRSTDAGKTWTQISELEPVGRVVRILKNTAYWMGKDGILVSKDQGATWVKQGTAVDATIGPMLDPKDEKHFAAAGMKGIFETTDGGETWKRVGSLPPGFSMPKAGWFANVAWDPAREIFYASQMGKPTYKLAIEKK